MKFSRPACPSHVASGSCHRPHHCPRYLRLCHALAGIRLRHEVDCLNCALSYIVYSLLISCVAIARQLWITLLRTGSEYRMPKHVVYAHGAQLSTTPSRWVTINSRRHIICGLYWGIGFKFWVYWISIQDAPEGDCYGQGVRGSKYDYYAEWHPFSKWNHTIYDAR